MTAEETSKLQLFADEAGHMVEVLGPLTDPVRFCPQGGGLSCSMPKARFLVTFKPCEPPQVFQRVSVTGDWLPDGFALEAYTDGLHWNGWATPYFSFDAARKLLSGCPNLRYDEASDTFIANQEGYADDGEGEETFKPVTLAIDGQPVKTYPIGTGSWCWYVAE